VTQATNTEEIEIIAPCSDTEPERGRPTGRLYVSETEEDTDEEVNIQQHSSRHTVRETILPLPIASETTKTTGLELSTTEDPTLDQVNTTDERTPADSVQSHSSAITESHLTTTNRPIQNPDDYPEDETHKILQWRNNILRNTLTDSQQSSNLSATHRRHQEGRRASAPTPYRAIPWRLGMTIAAGKSAAFEIRTTKDSWY
jgi:hypothetical protein